MSPCGGSSERLRSLVTPLGDALRAHGCRLATAESCTGGMIAAACTAIAGSSDWFERGFVTYSNEAKTEMLGVAAALIQAHGAVSLEVACAMAEGALARSHADIAVAVTGIAGPSGGSAAKPVGTVWLVLARKGDAAKPELLQLQGDRAAVRSQTVQRALQRCWPRHRRDDVETFGVRRSDLPPMSILVAADFSAAEWAEWWPVLQAALPGEVLLRERSATPVEQIDIALVANPKAGSLQGLPALRLVQSLWAGVDRLLADPTVPPEVPLTRMVDPVMNEAMAQTALWAVLGLHRGFFAYAEQQRAHHWQQHPQRRADEFPVAVLGLGQMGRAVAQRLVRNGYPVRGWSTRATAVEGVLTSAGDAALPQVLGAARIVINLLPLTPLTRGLFNAQRLAQMPRGASLVNLARGAHVVEADLLAVLDSGHLDRAVLDVFGTEPLPAGHAFWSHPRVTVLPHVAALTDPRSAAEIVARNVRALRQGAPLQHLVDRSRGY